MLTRLDRYLPLLRTLTASPSARAEMLATVAAYWARSSQFHLIVLDKLLQYRLVDSSDVLAWIFSTGSRKCWAGFERWTALEGTLRTVEARVTLATAKVEGLRAEAEREKALAGVQDSMVDIGALRPSLPIHNTDKGNTDAMQTETESDEILAASSSLSIVQSELSSLIISIIKHFNTLIPVQPTEADKDDWEVWWVEGWFREFCRSVRPPPSLYLSLELD
jgi:nuclear cap-binding protein subunit 1